jgi:hypothetical protein
MLHAVAMNLTPDLHTAQPDLGACDFGEIGEADLIALLEKFRTIDPVQNLDAEPYIAITAASGKFHVRTNGQKLFLYDARDSAKAGMEMEAAAIARDLARAPAKPDQPKVDATPRPRRPRNGIAAAILCAGVLLNGYTLYSFFYIEDVNQKPPIVLVTDGRELAGLRLSAAGRYATGKIPGDRIIEIEADDRVRFLRVTPSGERLDSTDTFRIGRHDKVVCLTTPDSGVIDVINIETISYYGDVYRRVR